MSSPSLEDLICSCLEVPESERAAHLEAICAAHPEQAPSLRRMYAQLARMGFVDDAAEATRSTGGWRLPDRLGNFQLEQPIGRGGMGVVYRARQTSLSDRIVALKILRPDLVEDSRAKARFVREALLASRLDHPNLCGVLEVGQDEGVAWLAMPFIEGRSLADCVAEARTLRRNDPHALPPLRRDASTTIDELLLAFVAIAAGLEHAHARGLLHRDVKPGNVMIQPDGTPVVLDFGLARDLEDHSRLTLSADLLGTPAYMAPEQVHSKTQLDPRVDVYSLGATLYECLTLELPHPAASRDEMLRRIRTDPAPDPRVQAPWLPRPVAEVVQGALQPDRQRRYESVGALAADLQRVLDRRPVIIRRPTHTQRAASWVRRNPWPAAASGILTVALAITLWLAESARRSSSEALAGDLIGRSLAAQSYDELDALRFAIDAFDTHDSQRARDRLHAAMRAMLIVARLPIESLGSLALAFDGRGDRLAAVFHRTLVVVDRTGQVQHRVDSPTSSRAVLAEVDGEWIAVLAGADGKIRRWRERDPARLEELAGAHATVVAGQETFTCSALGGERRIAVFGSGEGWIYEVDLSDGIVDRWAPEGPPGAVGHCLVLADDTVVATRNHAIDPPRDPTQTSQLCYRQGGEVYGPIPVQGPRGYTLGVQCLASAPEASQVWLGVPYGLVLFDLGKRAATKRFTTVYDVSSVAADPNFVYAGLEDGIILRWQHGGEDKPLPIAWHVGTVDRLVAIQETLPGFGALGTLVSSSVLDKTIQIGRASGWRTGPPLHGISAAATGLALDPRGELLASATADGSLQIWRRRDPTPSLTHPTGPFFGPFVFADRDETLLAQVGSTALRGRPETGELERLAPMALGNDRPFVAFRAGRIARADNLFLSIHDGKSGELLAPPVKLPVSSCGLEILDSDVIWVALNGGPLQKPRFQTWKLVEGELQQLSNLQIDDTWDEHQFFWEAAEASSSGALFVVACRDGTVRCYSPRGVPIGEPLAHSTRSPRQAVLRIAIAPGDRRLLSSCQDGTVKIWSRKPDGSFGSERLVTDFPTAAAFVDFDQSGSRIVCSSVAGILRVLDRAGGEPIEEFNAGTDLFCCRFTPDGQRVAATTNDGRLLTWFLDHRELRERAAALLPAGSGGDASR